MAAAFLLLLLPLLASSPCALSLPAPRPPSRPPGPAWAARPQGHAGRLWLRARVEAVEGRRHLGQRVPVRRPPSPNPNGPTTMFQPTPPPPSYR